MCPVCAVCVDVYPDLWNFPPHPGKKKTGKYRLKTNVSVSVCVSDSAFVCVCMADRKGRAGREGKAEGVKVLLLKQAIYKKRLQACCQITQYARACTHTHTLLVTQAVCEKETESDRLGGWQWKEAEGERSQTSWSSSALSVCFLRLFLAASLFFSRLFVPLDPICCPPLSLSCQNNDRIKEKYLGLIRPHSDTVGVQVCTSILALAFSFLKGVNRQSHETVRLDLQNKAGQ